MRVVLLTSLHQCQPGMDWKPVVMWGTQRTRGTYSDEAAAVGGCSWWGHTGLASHPQEQRPTREGSDAQQFNSVKLG